jgi:hypothetical protein
MKTNFYLLIIVEYNYQQNSVKISILPIFLEDKNVSETMNNKLYTRYY